MKSALSILPVVFLFAAACDTRRTPIDVPPDKRVADVGTPDRSASRDLTHKDTVIKDVLSIAPAVWVTIPAGTYLMGSPTTEPCRPSAPPSKDPEALHLVTLTNTFEIHATEVTQEQFAAVMQYNPSLYKECGGTCPVERVTWHDAAAYCNRLSVAKGLSACYVCGPEGADAGQAKSIKCQESVNYAGAGIYKCPGFRLPTEAEWEFAYRAGTTTAYYSGPSDPGKCGKTPVDPNVDDIAWYGGLADAMLISVRPHLGPPRGA